jgi:hypothetical protein
MKILSYIAIIALMLVLGCKAKKVQDKPITLKKLAKPVSDTSAYTRSLVVNKEKFIGKEFSLFLNELDIPVKSYSSTTLNKVYNNGVIISFDDWNTTLKKTNTSLGEKRMIRIVVIWKTPLLRSEVATALGRAGMAWGEAEEKFYSKCIISDIR